MVTGISYGGGATAESSQAGPLPVNPAWGLGTIIPVLPALAGITRGSKWARHGPPGAGAGRGLPQGGGRWQGSGAHSPCVSTGAWAGRGKLGWRARLDTAHVLATVPRELWGPAGASRISRLDVLCSRLSGCRPIGQLQVLGRRSVGLGDREQTCAPCIPASAGSLEDTAQGGGGPGGLCPHRSAPT